MPEALLSPFDEPLTCSACGKRLPLGWYCKNGDGRRASRCRTCRGPSNAASNHRRRALLASPGAGAARAVTEADLRQLLAFHVKHYGWRCPCGDTLLNGYHYDHVIALAAGGQHCVENLQVLCPRCNLRKGAR